MLPELPEPAAGVSSSPASHEHSTHGLGPWPGGPAAWPRGDHYDPDLLREGDTRNVIDRYRYWRHEAIVADLATRRHTFHVAIENWQHDMNIGSIVRSANAFGAEAVHIIGRRRWNKRGAMVTDRYQTVYHHDEVAAFVAWCKTAKLPIVAVDNVPGSVPLESFRWPARVVMLFGQEGPGLTVEAIAAAGDVVEISQYGSTRSINASAAGAVAMFSWCQQHSEKLRAEQLGG